MFRNLTLTILTATLAFSASAYAQGGPPASDVIGAFHACNAARSPSATEVYIFDAVNAGGNCRALVVGFYPNPEPLSPGSFGLANDAIRSIRTGSDVRARLFKDIVYGGDFTIIPPNVNFLTMPSGFSAETSSIRVEVAARAIGCNDLSPGEFAVFRNLDFVTGDCVVLHYGRTYAQPVNMGIANDDISSVRPGPLFLDSSSDPNCNGLPFRVWLYSNGGPSGNAVSILSGDLSNTLVSFDNTTSGISTGVICRF